ncbi:pilus (MSHA type) biogenesis protein MshL [Oxalobacteraceae bacterium A2-2]
MSPTLPAALAAVLLAGCAAPSIPPSPNHLSEPALPAGAIPDVVQESAALPPPKAAPKLETYSVTVHKVPVQSLLFALARDAGMNADIHPAIDGLVTLNALDQTLPQLLSRIAGQVDMRYEINGSTLVVQPDTPVWRNYKIDYVNIARSTISSVNIATQISTTGGSGAGGTAATSSANSANASGSSSTGASQTGNTPAGYGTNNSTTVVNNRSDNNFWYNLEKNIRDMLRASNLSDNPVDPLSSLGTAAGTAGAAAPAAGQNPAAPAQPAAPAFDASAFGGSRANKNSSSVVVNPEGGLIAVRATARQHEKIREFLDIVLGAAKRQVLIEATVIEVKLSDQYQQGINWSSIGKGGLTLKQGQVGSTTLPSGVNPGTSAGLFVLNFANAGSRLGNIASTIQLLESFGKVKVLSSPKISVLNNQTAMLKVVDNNVFFTIKVTPAVINSTGGVTTPATYESSLQTVPVGFVMSVTPQISDDDQVTLNVRPTITRIVGYENDPNPALADAKVTSKIPIIQAREMDSIMKVPGGQIAVMGGLMMDSVDNTRDQVPGLGSIPVLGNLFSYRNETSTKTELVIFMRPVVVKDASINGDYQDYRYLLPAPGQAAPNAAAPAATTQAGGL